MALPREGWGCPTRLLGFSPWSRWPSEIVVGAKNRTPLRRWDTPTPPLHRSRGFARA